MKKLLLLVAVATFGFSNLNAQGDIKFGVKAGANLATLNGDLEDLKSKLSFHIGGVVEIPLTEKFSFQPELLYSSQGAELDEGLGFGGVSFNAKYKLDYVNVPLMAKYYVIDNLGVEFGPLVGFLVSAKFDDETDEEDIKDNFKSIDFGLAAGASYKLDFGLNFGLRYNLGLADINDVDGSDAKINNGVFQVSVGYMF
ncbi:porin family protein [Winogradskyella forsetii]|uniref:porin family protein n=1 Tax=Winogradskyella forsetii TaxID=2686077 RepID=UPI0015BD9C14|nr:porin family protein [Winogradskyella forsetii]